MSKDKIYFHTNSDDLKYLCAEILSRRVGFLGIIALAVLASLVLYFTHVTPVTDKTWP